MSSRLDVKMRPQPMLRGSLHQWASGLFLASCMVLIVVAGSARSRIAMAIYGAGLMACLVASTAYHRGHWSPRAKHLLSRFDHAAIFLLIAGTYTPICVLVLSGALGVGLLIGVWCGAAVGIALSFCWPEPPAWIEVGPYLALGWAAVIAMPTLNATLGWGALLLLFGGGALYSVGAVIYGRKRPDPFPTVFGYHEIFHACTVLAAAANTVLIYVWVLPRGWS